VKLHYNRASPYARKVLVTAHEAGLAERLELLPRAHTPVAPDADLNRDNPLGKIPCLITDDGTSLFDSRVICAYLDHLAGAGLVPAAGPERWQVLRQEALADGIMDAAVLTRYELVLRPADQRWAGWIEGQMAKIRRALDALEQAAAGPGDRIDAGAIALGCALGYLDFRYPHEAWRTGRPALAAWQARLAARPSMQASAPA
jgi:glutathione S-transferase